MYHVHVAFGFHVNCYHSYRGDTPDALGFGGDIRIIRHILDTLDDRNARGIPVKGTWDFENAYSLEQILPEHAPDIIERVKQRGDENILMGYNNGAMSAMTEDEFAASVAWAVTNPYGSGLKDVFGDCRMIIRPQEVMFSPTQIAAYHRAGVEAVCLYYSCISFDAFRTLIPQLPDALAFNPLWYSYGGEKLKILPTYSPNDVMDAGSLRALCSDLHAQQEVGKIKSDVLLFLNTDADSFLWEPMAGPMAKVPCFGGIGGYIDEIADLDYVVFDTPGNYLASHEPAGEVTFGQDVADGNLSGYMSWSEKPFNRLVWSRLERARQLASAQGKDADSASFETRLRLLSTTHFGLASPVMNVTREEKALSLSEKALRQEREALGSADTLTLKAAKPQSLFSAQLTLADGFCDDVTQLQLSSEHLRCFTACETGRYKSGCVSSIYLLARYDDEAAERTLAFSLAGRKPLRAVMPEAEGLKLELRGGQPMLRHPAVGEIPLRGWIDYDSKRYSFSHPLVLPLALAGAGEGVRLQGAVHLPGQVLGGSYVIDVFSTPAAQGLIVRSGIRYPYTPENHEISSQASNLGRFSDNRWRQTAPLELSLTLNDRAAVTKRSFTGACSRYEMADFWRAFPENENIASINHQLTGGTLSLADDRGGILLAHARCVLGSMAHCPMRLETKDGGRIVRMNPFGTYFGAQRYYPSRGNGSSMDLYLAAAPQARSLAPAYNGAFEQAVQAVFPIFGTEATDQQQREAEAIADGAAALGGDQVCAFDGDNVSLRPPVDNKVAPKDLKSVTFVEQCGGVMPVLRMLRRYFTNLLVKQAEMKRREKD